MTSPFSALARTTLLVRDYDEALKFYRDVLGLQVVMDLTGPDGERMLHVGLANQTGVGIWLQKATAPEDLAHVGKQAGSHPLLVFYTADCRRSADALAALGVKFRQPATQQMRAVVAIFEDVYGNALALAQLMTG